MKPSLTVPLGMCAFLLFIVTGDLTTFAQSNSRNLCQAAAQSVSSTCAGKQVWTEVGTAATSCFVCKNKIDQIVEAASPDWKAALSACSGCISILGPADQCAIALTHWSECQTPCVGKANGTNICFGPNTAYGLEFAQCQENYPSMTGTCKTDQFCDSKKAFVWGSANPPQCADCDNDHGQAPSSSYHNGEGYCMPSTGNAPGWHECVSKTGGPGGHWLYLPQLNNQRNCHPTPVQQPGPAGPK